MKKTIAVALYDYTGVEPSHLSFKAGESIQICSKDDSGWWDGICLGRRGWYDAISSLLIK